MKTPNGKECDHYYADYHRGRDVQECRLVEKNPESKPWKPHHCQLCPVPDILRTTRDGSLKLDITIRDKWFGFKEEFRVEGWCSECFSEVPDPMKGCPNCSKSGPSILDLMEGPN